MTGTSLYIYLKKSFITGSLKTFIITLSTIIFLPLIIKQIGLEVYGLISITMIFSGMVVFADFGISKSVTLLIGKNNDQANEIFTSALLINSVFLFIIALILILLVMLNIPILGEKLNISSNLQHYIIFIGFMSLLLMLINNLLTALLESFYLVHYINIGFMLSSILTNAFIYLASILTNSIYLIIMSPIFSLIFVTFYFIKILRMKTSIKLKKPDKTQIKTMLSTSYKFFNIGLINSIIIPANKYFLIYLTGNSTLLGIFDIALKIALIANSFLNSIAQPLFGVFSNIKTSNKDILNICKKTSLIIFLLYIVGNSVFYFLGEYITYFIDTKNQNELFSISMILLLGISFSSVSEPFYRALLGTERLKESLYLKMIIPVFNVVVYYCLINIQILERFAISFSFATFFSSLIIILYFIKKQTK